MDNFFAPAERRELPELNLVPVIDMFTTVIFFLLLSTVFIAFNKLTIPPSRVSTVSDPVALPPIAPIFVMGKSAKAQDQLSLRLSWSGRSPGQFSETVPLVDIGQKPEALVAAAKKLSGDFHQKFPEERTLRVGLERGLAYQNLISAMDGLREAMPDLVLISYDEAEMRLKGTEP